MYGWETGDPRESVREQDVAQGGRPGLEAALGPRPFRVRNPRMQGPHPPGPPPPAAWPRRLGPAPVGGAL